MVKRKKKNILSLPAKFSRKLYFGCWLVIALVAVSFCVEIVCGSIFVFFNNESYSRVALQKRLNEVVAFDTLPVDEIVPPDARDFISGFMPHPYVGFVENPQGNPNINTYGWEGPPPVTKRRNDTVTIAIFGGSVAKQFYHYNLELFLSLLRQSPVFYGKRIEVINAALEGYKQPQQLLALEYLLSQGAEYDVMINIDGFNEVTLTGTDNYIQQVAPIFPRSWNWYAQTLHNSQTVYQITLLYIYRDIRKIIASAFSFYPFREFMLTLRLWNSIDERIVHAAQQEVLMLRNSVSITKHPSYQLTGPVDRAITSETLTAYSVSIWKNSSVQMNYIARLNNMIYIHVLQPNVYYLGSKSLTSTEKKHAAIDADIPYDDPRLGLTYQQLAYNGYPMLVQTGQEYLQYQENFLDLTRVFIHEQGDIYVDNCHYNENGKRIVTEAIAKEVISLYKEKNR